ncbi:MAG: HAD hydrolase-like protein [Alphaproteobacteria bacterium]|nr:HAD hydrolase-like protein [Alphaproteobacteria bacterium]
MRPDKFVIVFDYNGVILEDAKHHWRAFNGMAEKVGAKPVSYAEYRLAFRIPLKEMYADLGICKKVIAERTDDLHRFFGEAYNGSNQGVCPRRGVIQALSYIKGQGHKAIILSNHTKEDIRKQLKRFDLDNCFSAVLANGHDEHQDIMYKAGKGKRLENWLKNHHVRGGIVVGDTPEEVHIARGCGFFSMGLTGGFCLPAAFKGENEPDFLRKDLRPMPAIIAECYKRLQL